MSKTRGGKRERAWRDSKTFISFLIPQAFNVKIWYLLLLKASKIFKGFGWGKLVAWDSGHWDNVSDTRPGGLASPGRRLPVSGAARSLGATDW